MNENGDGTRYTADEIVWAAEEALKRGDAPVVYIHPDPRGPATIAIVRVSWLRTYFDGSDMEPHSHIEPGMF